ncbi:hypothetical protein HYP22_gp42 [Escherichia phage ESSI2_ev015]|uniref:Uncharacterized protein n=1 Tax=Escherichia phage ESSI2_ev015 TaxID=2695850 RepID=A0A653FV23_9CAUD|nr:hypothetical protein HYP22_gp42 [Escherichia phage ESSI2_ev015]VUF53814.1 hypothetical protein [Escherichia phage ESSI2_ev015]
MATNCYVRVLDNNTKRVYDVGPFINSGNEAFSGADSAINWIYKQIGLVKIQYPESTLIKHKWDYVKDDFYGPTADVKVEISNFIFEIFKLLPADTQNVINEQITDNLPTWYKDEKESHIDEN